MNGDPDLEATGAGVWVEAFAVALEAGSWDGLITGGVEGVISDGFYGGADGRDVIPVFEDSVGLRGDGERREFGGVCGKGADFDTTELIEITNVVRIVNDAISGIGMPSFNVLHLRHKVCPLGRNASVEIAEAMAVESWDSKLIAVDDARRIEWGDCG